MNNNWLMEKKRIENRVQYMLKDKIQHWSCTISPSYKSLERKEIESLYEGLAFYRDKLDSPKVILQKKHMGSYCAVYLFQNVEDTKFFSRGCYPIRKIERERLVEAARDLHSSIITGNVTEAVVECELMPWSAMGQGLIDKEYRNYYILHNDHKNFLMSSSISEKLDKVRTSNEYKYWEENGSDKSHINRQYSSAKALKEILPEITEYSKSIQLFKEQVDKYGTESKNCWLEPFNLVFYVQDGQKIINYDNSYFNKDTLQLDLEDWDNSVKKAYDYQTYMNDHEGIMIKPLKSGIVGIPHALKVRTNDYLQMIYGINFDKKYEYYLNKRNVGRKISASCGDYRIHCALVNCNNDEERRNLYYEALDAEKFAESLDTRL